MQKIGLKSYEASVIISRGQRAFSDLLAICLSHNGLTIPEWSLLGWLYGQNGARPHLAAKFLGVKPPFTTKLIADLERKGLIEVIPYPDDERGKQIRLSAHGRSHVEKVEAKLQKCLSEQFSGANKDQLSNYFSINRYMSEQVRHV